MLVVVCNSPRLGLRPEAPHPGSLQIRDLEFRRPLTVSILSERRVHAPYGLAGGHAGERGRNILVRADGRRLNLGGKNTVAVQPGDRLVIHTPGGGGYGPPNGGARATAAERGGRVRATIRDGGSVAEYNRLQESA